MAQRGKRSPWSGRALKTPAGKLLIVLMVIGGVLIYPTMPSFWIFVGICVLGASGVALGLLEMYLQWTHEKNMADSTQESASEKPKPRKFGCLTVIAFWLVAIFVFGIIGSLIEGPKRRLVDATFAPVIEALDKYKSTNGRYPDKLDVLLLAHLRVLPSCPDSTKPGAGYYVDPKSGEYILGCYTFLSTKRLYDSRTKRWESSD